MPLRCGYKDDRGKRVFMNLYSKSGVWGRLIHLFGKVWGTG